MVRPVSEEQVCIGTPAISELRLDFTCRDEIIPIAYALQYIHVHSRFRDRFTGIIMEELGIDAYGHSISSETGRPGLSAWCVGVLVSLRLGLNCDYDKLQDLTTNHRLVRTLLGLAEWRDEGFNHRRIGCNISHISEEGLRSLNQLVVEAGHQALNQEASRHVRVDSFVLETNTHYPTDSRQVFDGVGKLLTIGARLCEDIGLTIFRQHEHHRRTIKNGLRCFQRAIRSRAKNRANMIRSTCQKFLNTADHVCELSLKLLDVLAEMRNQGADGPGLVSIGHDGLVNELMHFLSGTAHVVHLARKRIIDGQEIDHEDKLFSLFEPHAELINRGKYPTPHQLGHRCFVAEDEFGFVVDYGVMKNGQQDAEMVPLLIESFKNNTSIDPITISFDRGYHSQKNQELLKDAIPTPCLQAKGNAKHIEQWQLDDETYRKARLRHSGIESCINALYHNGLSRCRDRGLKAYHQYLGLGVLGRNLITLGRHLIAIRHPNSNADLSRRKPPIAAA